jgi:hypothetical protein
VATLVERNTNEAMVGLIVGSGGVSDLRHSGVLCQAMVFFDSNHREYVSYLI